jgi:hypothetical protein
VCFLIPWVESDTFELKLYPCSQRIHPEDGHMTGRNMLVTSILLKCIDIITVRLLVSDKFDVEHSELTENVCMCVCVCVCLCVYVCMHVCVTYPFI